MDRERNKEPAQKSWAKSSTKNEARAGAQAELRSFSGAWKAAPRSASADFGCAHPLKNDELQKLTQDMKASKSIGLFVAHEKWREAQDIEGSLLDLLGAEAASKISYPRLKSDRKHMEFARCRLSETVKEDGLNWQSAPKTLPAVVPEWIVAPALAADSWGQRLGRGQGHYDRYFSQNPGVRRIGCLHSDFVVEQFPPSWIEDHDVTVELLWTERGLYKTPAIRPETDQLFAFKEKRK